MISAKDRAAQINAIAARYGANSKGELHLVSHTIEEAQEHLAIARQIQKELRQVKREIAQDVKEIRTEATTQRAKIQATSPFTSLFRIRGAGHFRAAGKHDVTKRMNELLQPYRNLSQNIDRTLMVLDGQKLQIEAAINKERAKKG